MANKKQPVAAKTKVMSSGESLVSVGLTLPPATVEALDQAARKSVRTRAGEMRFLIEWGLAQREAGKLIG